MCVGISRTVTLTEEMVEKYSVLSGDFNPIHLDPEEAKKNQFERPIAHGMLVMGFGAEVIKELAEKGKLVQEYEMNFLQPVYIDDSVKFVVEGQSDSNDVTIRGYVREKIVVRGKARVR